MWIGLALGLLQKVGSAAASSIYVFMRVEISSQWGKSAGPGLTVSLGSFTSQQLARSLWLEVAAGDVLTVTTV